MLFEVNTDGIPRELTIICYFQKNLKPSIKIEIEQ